MIGTVTGGGNQLSAIDDDPPLTKLLQHKRKERSAGRMNEFQRMLAKWGFRPIDSNGQPTVSELMPEEKSDKPKSNSAELAKQILSTPDVQIL